MHLREAAVSLKTILIDACGSAVPLSLCNSVNSMVIVTVVNVESLSESWCC